MRRRQSTLSIPEPLGDTRDFLPPDEYKTNRKKAKQKDIKQLIKLIESNSSETIIDKFITLHPELLCFVISLYSTGHHHTWVIPKKVVKTKTNSNDKGLVPDFIIGGQSTSGKEWFILELKGANTNLFVEKASKIYFTDIINKGLHQLIEYLDYCDTYQSKFRDEHKLIDFKKPKAILMAGRRNEFQNNQRKKSIIQTWRTLLGNRLEIVTYDRLVDQLKIGLKDLRKNKGEEFSPFD